MYDIESAFKISQFRHREFLELAERERLIKLARHNQPSNQSLGAKIIDLFKPCPANDANKGKPPASRTYRILAALLSNSHR